MLNSKPKRNQPFGRPSRFGDEARDAEPSSWSSPSSPTPPVDLVDAAQDGPRTRVLRTQDDKPTAPKLHDFFPQETRPIDRVITFWDPGSTWPATALGELVGPQGAEPGATRLVHAQTERSFALIRHSCLMDGQGRVTALLHVEASAAEAACADVALMLLERSDHAAVLSGGSAEHRELPRRLQEFCRQAAWRGPTLQFVAPQDKPSRSDRLRKITWPRSLRVQVLELPTDSSPASLAAVLTRVADGLGFPGLTAPAAAAVPGAPLSTELPPPPPLPSEPLPPRPAVADCVQALDMAALTPGLTGAAVIDVYTQHALAQQGDAQLTEAGVRSALQHWHRHAAQAPEDDETEAWHWRSGSTQHIVLPVPAHPGLLLLGLLGGDGLDLAQARWQLGVARNQFA